MILINNTDKSITDVDSLIKLWRNNTKDKVITPEMALDFLKLTNHHANIKFLIKTINANIKTDEDAKKYEEFVGYAIKGREVTDQTYKMLEELALRGGFEQMFEAMHLEFDKVYKSGDCKSVIAYDDGDFRKKIKGDIPVVGDFTDYSGELFLSGTDFTNCRHLFFGRDITRICMNKAVGLKSNLFIPNVCDVEFCGADLSGVKKMYGNRNNIDMREAKGLPEVIDVSKARKVRFDKADLSGVKELKIGECKDISFAFSKGLPEVINVSQCDEISFHKADVANVKKAYFKDIADAEHFFCYSKNCKASMFYLSDTGWKEYNPLARVRERER